MPETECGSQNLAASSNAPRNSCPAASTARSARSSRSAASPLFIARASGSRLTDVDGNTFIDYVMSWGPLIHGHAPKGLANAIARAARGGTSFGAPSPLEVALAERVCRLMPSIERVRFVNSGTEATMSAVRVARAATGRDRIIKFQGCYHGHADAFLVQAGSGALTFGVPNSPGVTAGASADTLVASYNDLASVHQVFAAHRDQIAAVIVEPIAGNMGVVPPADGFLRGLREACTAHGALLIFDEVISGFRASRGGAQAIAACARTSRAWARSSAAGCRSAPTAAARI